MSQAQADEFAALDATAQAELVRRKEVKPIELVEAAIKRIERINPTINAVITPMFDEARAAANGALPEGPFTGVPVADCVVSAMRSLPGAAPTSSRNDRACGGA